MWTATVVDPRADIVVSVEKHGVNVKFQELDGYMYPSASVLLDRRQARELRDQLDQALTEEPPTEAPEAAQDVA